MAEPDERRLLSGVSSRLRSNAARASAIWTGAGDRNRIRWWPWRWSDPIHRLAEGRQRVGAVACTAQLSALVDQPAGLLCFG